MILNQDVNMAGDEVDAPERYASGEPNSPAPEPMEMYEDGEDGEYGDEAYEDFEEDIRAVDEDEDGSSEVGIFDDISEDGRAEKKSMALIL